MRSIILYSTLKPAHGQHCEYAQVWIDGTCLFIRGESHPGDVLEALNNAGPLEGETVLNSIPAE